MTQYYSYVPSQLVENFNKLLEKVDSTWDEKEARVGSSPGLVVAATQITGAGLSSSEVEGFVSRAEACIAKAAQAGANLVLIQELFSGPYFCQSQEADLLKLAQPVQENPLIRRFQSIARSNRVVLPISFFESCKNMHYNSVVMIDSDGSVSDTIYRKSHIPDGTGYQEKFYFSPGDSGFHVFDTSVGKVGVAICWDQWFPEAARIMAIQGADVLLYPTAIGSEPQDPTLNSSMHWQRVMQGHSAANMVPVVASNRFGTEVLLNEDSTEKQRIHFYGKSFITDNTGALIAECVDNSEDNPYCFVLAEIDTKKNREERAAWGLFRDRRPEVYGAILTKDGESRYR